MTLFNRSLAIFTAFSVTACSSTAKLDDALARGRCEEGEKLIPEQNDLGVKTINSSKQIGGTLVSYTFTGASYTAEILWDVLGGTVMVVALCGPTMAAIMASSNSTGPGGEKINLECLPGKFDALQAPHLGRAAYASTKELRCPPVTHLSRSVREVARCYQKSGSVRDLEKANQSLTALRNSGQFYDCLPRSEQIALDEQLASLSALR